MNRYAGILLGMVWNTIAWAQPAPGREAFTVIQKTPTEGPSITGLLQYQTRMAWTYDEQRSAKWNAIPNEKGLIALQAETRKKILDMIGNLPDVKTPLNTRVTGRVQQQGFYIDKIIFESLPGYHVPALVYVPENGIAQHPAVLVACGHSPLGKIYYQPLCQRLVRRGYIVICWDPVGQGERSQFWDAQAGKSRYNLYCGEHAVLGNLAYLAGTNLLRWEIWDGMRAVDYLLTRPDVDARRLSITGTSGGGTQTGHIGVLDERISTIAPSCYISALPMRAYNRIFADPDSDPEQDLYGTLSNGVDHAGLLLLAYPRPIFIASAVLDFFPIEGTRRTYREISSLYTRFGHGDRTGFVEGYHKHQFSPENQEAALNFLDRFNDMPLREGLPVLQEISESELRCTTQGQLALEYPQEKKLTELIRDYYQSHQNNSLTTAGVYFGHSYPGIKDWTVTPYDGSPARDKITWQKVGRQEAGGIQIDQYLLRHSSSLQIPLLYFHGSKASAKTILWIDLYGKASAAQWPWVKEQLRRGNDVISFDLRGTGEDRMHYQATSSDELTFEGDAAVAYFHPLSSVMGGYVYNGIITGRPYFLQMIEDTEIVSRFASHVLSVHATAIASSGDAQLLAGEIAKTLTNVPLADTGAQQVMTWSQIVQSLQEKWPIQYVMPGGAYIR